MKLSMKIAALLLWAVALAGLAASPASAAFTQNFTFTSPTTAITPTASPGALTSYGFTDVTGSTYGNSASGYLTVLTGNKILSVTGVTVASGVDQREQQDFTYASNGSYLYNVGRLQPSNTTYYEGGIIDSGTGTATVYKVVAGASTVITASANFGLTVGTRYTLQTDFVSSGGSTVITVSVIRISDGVVMNTVSTAGDTEPTLQGQSSNGYATTDYVSGGSYEPVTNLRTYTGAAPVAATAYTLTTPSPSSGPNGAASQNFTLTANGTLSTADTVTLSDGGAGGTFTPASPVLPASSSPNVTFTYTPATTGTITITPTNAGGLTNPGAVTYSSQTLITLAACGPSVKLSPGNWKGCGSTARIAGLAYPQTASVGAYFYAVWNASASPTATILAPSNSNNTQAISCFLNGKIINGSGTPFTGPGTITITPIASSLNTLWCPIRNSSNLNIWNAASNDFQFQGVQIDGASSPCSGQQCPVLTKWAEIECDSVCEGIHAGGGVDDFFESHTFMYMQQLIAQGYDVSVRAITGTSFNAPNTSAGAPPDYPVTSGAYQGNANGRAFQVDQGVSFLDSNGQLSAYGFTGTPPALIMWETLGNDFLQTTSLSDLTASVSGLAGALRAAAPAAKIVFFWPPQMEYLTACGYNGPSMATYNNAYHQGLTNANAAGANVLDTDLGQALATQIYGTTTFNGGGNCPHIGLFGHALESPYFMNAINQALKPGPTYVNRVH